NRAPAPRRVTSHRNASPANEQERTPVTEETATQAVTTEPEPQPATEQTVAAAPTVPMVAPRPAPAPIVNPGASGRGARAGSAPEGLGDVIGVILRGGSVGDDHCVPRGRRGRGVPFPGFHLPMGPRIVIQR